MELLICENEIVIKDVYDGESN